MDVKFISTTSDKLSELAILNGQLIYLSDRDATYYDLGNTRNLISSVKLVSSLPSTATVQESVLYGLVGSGGEVQANIWDASASTYRVLSGGGIATTAAVGLVKPDGTSIVIDSNGTISTNLTSFPSSAVTYDNTVSGFSATSVQTALDEVAGMSTAFASSVSSLDTRIVTLERLADVALISALPSTTS